MRNLRNEWKKWEGDKTIEQWHDKIGLYRAAASGDHVKLSDRAQMALDKGDYTEQIYDLISKQRGGLPADKKIPYLTINISKLIVEVPATLISRSIGQVSTSTSVLDQATEGATEELDSIVDGPDNDTASGEFDNLQKETIDSIVDNSKLELKHFPNIAQIGTDGGLVGLVVDGIKGIRIDFKPRDCYFPHDDELGADLVFYFEEMDEEDPDKEPIKYLHVYTERVEDANADIDSEEIALQLRTTHKLYNVNEDGKLTQEDDAVAMDVLNLRSVLKVYKGRSSEFISYYANKPTPDFPTGTSELKGVIGKQDEVNWSLTRQAAVFHRNGKPRIGISQEMMVFLRGEAFKKYGDASMIDEELLEVFSLDKNGKGMEIYQIDVTKIGGFEHIKQVVKAMLLETSTSEAAIDFSTSQTGTTGAQSGISKFYDLMVSVLKAEEMRKQYIYFLKNLLESAMWIAHEKDEKIMIEKPDIATASMIPISRKELIEQEILAYKDGAQSLETTVRNINPLASEEWIQAELERIELDSTNVGGGLFAGSSALLDNRDVPLVDDPSATNPQDPESDDA